jgi:hypothetical protein
MGTGGPWPRLWSSFRAAFTEPRPRCDTAARSACEIARALRSGGGSSRSVSRMATTRTSGSSRFSASIRFTQAQHFVRAATYEGRQTQELVVGAGDDRDQTERPRTAAASPSQNPAPPTYASVESRPRRGRCSARRPSRQTVAQDPLRAVPALSPGRRMAHGAATRT